jgi:hypothetical protein
MIFFVHVGKTAGSTLNRYLADSARGFAHCEAFIHDPAALPARLAEATWLSGHVSLPVARRRLAPVLSSIPGGIRYYTCVRRPAAQVRSHYNWLVEIFHKGPKFYDAHPAQIRMISEAVRATVAAPSPTAVAADLRRFAGLFLNCQSRYFFGPDLAALPKAEDADGFAALPAVRATVAAFDAIGESDAVETLANHILGTSRYSAANRRQENASRYHFDPALFESDEVQETLRLHNRVDALLYADLVRRMTDGLLVNRARPPLPAPAAEGELHG